MKNYFAYTRVSTVKQGEGVSLQEQKAAIQSYAQRNGLEVLSWFEEKETAAKRGRPVFGEMLKLIRKGKAQGIIVHKIDRSARNLKDWADLGELIDKGIEVHFANESLDLNTRGGRLSADIQAVIAADYIRNLKEEIRKGFYGRFKQGLYPWPAPLGYVDTGGGKPKDPDPQKASLVKKTFELYATGKYSLYTLTDEMYRLGLRTKKGTRVTKNGFSGLLNNPFYIGLIHLPSTGETFEGVHQPLITKLLFDRVQNVLKGKFNARTLNHDFLLRRMLRCRSCDYSLIGEKQKGHVYYRCHTRHPSPTSIREESVEETVLEAFDSFRLQKGNLNYLLAKVQQLNQGWTSDKEELKKSLDLQISNIKTRLDRLTDACIDGVLEKELFDQRKNNLLFEKKAMEEKRVELDKENHSIPKMIEEILEQADSAYVSYKLGSPDEKRNLLNHITSNRLVDGKKVQLQLKIPFQEMSAHGKLMYCGANRDRPRTRLNKLLKALIKYFTAQSQNGQEPEEISPLKSTLKKVA